MYPRPQGHLGRENAFVQLTGPLLYLGHTAVHLTGQHLDLSGQLLDLGGYHRKAPAGGSGSGRLNGGVDGQQIRLVRNGDDLSHTLLDAVDRRLKLAERMKHLVVGFLNLRGNAAQFHHLLLRVGNLLGDLAADLGD